MQLTKTYSQYKANTKENVPQSDLLITVEYEPQTREVTQTICVHSYDHDTRVLTDLTAIFAEQLNFPFELIVDSIDWTEVYAETMADKKEVA